MNIMPNKYILLLFVLLFFFCSISFAKEEHYSVFLISNIVDIKDSDTFNSRIKNIFEEHNAPFTLIVNGDLIDSKFKKNFKQDSIRIYKFLKAVSCFPNSNIVVIPGERDWDDSGKDGLKNVKRLEKLIKSFKFDNVKWALKNGCPGPNHYELNYNLLLITINTQWWNHPFDVPGPIDGKCKVATTDDFKEELEDLINENPNKNIIVAGHYPIFSNGEFGGHQPLKKHIFPLTDLDESLYIPLPIIGSFYTSYRENIGTINDVVNENYKETRKMLENILAQYQSIIYMSGQDKTQLIAERFGNFFINSGAPETASFSTIIDECRLEQNSPGIIEIKYKSNGQVFSTLHKFEENHETISRYNNILLESTCNKSETYFPLNYQYEPCKEIPKATTKMIRSYPSEGKVIAGPEYAADSFKRFLLGDHYRKSWTSVVTVPYLNLDTTKKGLSVIKRGGGRQTRSLKFKGGDGIRYVFRSVNKDPVKALDYDLRNTGIARIVKDQTTTQHPYGAMAADILLNELGIIHASPKLYLMPDDPKLGPFQEEFGNMLGMLEENPVDPPKGEKGYLGSTEIVRSNKLFRKLFKDHNNRVNSKEFAIARVFDVLVGDWGKHEDNWKWVGFNEGEKTIYRPMPRDRDHVFSKWDGVLPWLYDREWAKASGENFGYEIVGLRSLMNQARHLDRFLAADLSKSDWLEAAKFVRKKITPEVIELAVRNMPEEIYSFSGSEIETKLKARVNDLEIYAEDYYDMISPEVDIVGSNKNEYFDIIRNEDGSVQVNMFNSEGGKKGENLFYSRLLNPDETDDIRLYGLDGKDVFNFSGASNSSIKIRVIGGTGRDSVNNNAICNEDILIYDRGKKTRLTGNTNYLNRVFPYNESLYKYNRTAFNYNTYFPLPYISYNTDDGIILNAGVSFTLHSFDTSPFSSKHKFQIGASLEGSFGLEYSGRFHHLYKGWDLIFSAHYYNPLRYTYFYGFGNSTIKDESLYKNNYYRTRFSARGFSLGIENEFWKKSYFQLSARYDNNEHQEKVDGTIFSSYQYVGFEKINLVEGTAILSLDFRDNQILPTSGTSFYVEYKNGFVTNLEYENYGKLLLIGEGYISLLQSLPITFGLRIGGGKSFGKIPFYNQFRLGQNNYLKGYTNNRFTGSSIAFGQSALRVNLFGVEGPLVPMNVGFIGYFNTGRVFQPGENSNKWHNGYGGGFFVVPLREEFTIYTTVSFSQEESMLFEFGLGSGL